MAKIIGQLKMEIGELKIENVDLKEEIMVLKGELENEIQRNEKLDVIVNVELI